LTGNIVKTASRFAVILPGMFTRLFQLPNHSFFLIGPRGTGRTTWLRHLLPDALWFDLLRTQTLLALTRQPESFPQQVESRPKGSWVVVDEVQHLPSLLNEVHALIAERGRAYRFALSGSSARKLRCVDVNLLAGRAINRQFFPQGIARPREAAGGLWDVHGRRRAQGWIAEGLPTETASQRIDVRSRAGGRPEVTMNFQFP
jgi:hypothetical protein